MGANDTTALASAIGQPVLRKEDARFLTGTGQYTDDVAMPRQTHAYFLRSPHAHATIRAIDTSKAKDAPGVVAIFTGADLAGVNGLPCGWLITGTDGKPMHEQAPGNRCYTWALGDRAAVDAAFAKAAHVTKLDIVNNRLVPNAIEPR